MARWWLFVGFLFPCVFSLLVFCVYIYIYTVLFLFDSMRSVNYDFLFQRWRFSASDVDLRNCLFCSNLWKQTSKPSTYESVYEVLRSCNYSLSRDSNNSCTVDPLGHVKPSRHWTHWPFISMVPALPQAAKKIKTTGKARIPKRNLCFSFDFTVSK